jgi:hypothetical protein
MSIIKSKYDEAFPVEQVRTDNGLRNGSRGVSKREYFIAAALTGLLANPSYKITDQERSYPDIKNITDRAVEVADTLCNKLYEK